MTPLANSIRSRVSFTIIEKALLLGLPLAGVFRVPLETMNSIVRTTTAIAVGLLCSFLVLIEPRSAFSTSAHPFHSTLAEIEWNPTTERFEVALSLWPVDVEEVLSRDQSLLESVGGLIDLDQAEQHAKLDPALEAYVRSHLQLIVRQQQGTRPAAPSDSPRNASEHPTEASAENASADNSVGPPLTSDDSPSTGGAATANLQWLGFEVERDSVWCYFEFVPRTKLPEVETLGREPGDSESSDPSRTRSDGSSSVSDEASSETAIDSADSTRGSASSSEEESQERSEAPRIAIRSTMFHELHLDQENSALVKVAGRRFAVRCTVENPTALFPWPAR